MKLLGALFFIGISVLTLVILRAFRETPPPNIWVEARPEFSANTFDYNSDVAYCLELHDNGRIEPVQACLDRVWLSRPFARCGVQNAKGVAPTANVDIVAQNLSNLHVLGCKDVVLDFEGAKASWLIPVVTSLKQLWPKAYVVTSVGALESADRKALCEVADELLAKFSNVASVVADCRKVRLEVVNAPSQRGTHEAALEFASQSGVSALLIQSGH